jgi:hypothetical protein
VTVLFTAEIEGQPITVPEVRGRPAFLPHQLDIAAGYSALGHRFTEQITREWAPSLEEEGLAYLSGSAYRTLQRDLPDRPDVRHGLMLFYTGAEKCLRFSQVRRAKALAEFSMETMLPRFVAITGNDRPRESTALTRAIAGEKRPAPKSTLADAVAKIKPLGGRIQKLEDFLHGFREFVKLADDLRAVGVVTDAEWGCLRVEAMEHLLGRRLRTRLTLGEPLHPLPEA